MNRALLTTLCLSLMAVSAPGADPKPKLIEFGKNDLDKLPEAWKSTQTGMGKGSVWKVVEDATASSKTGFALAQTAKGPSALFNICVNDSLNLIHLEVKVALKAVKGDIDQGGGVVWRYQDANNYYVARFNPLEENLRVYKVIAGKRIQLATKEGLKSEAGQWHTLAVHMTGKQITCSLDGKMLLDVSDDALGGQGKVGLWTKADAQTHFDRFEVTNLGK